MVLWGVVFTATQQKSLSFLQRKNTLAERQTRLRQCLHFWPAELRVWSQLSQTQGQVSLRSTRVCQRTDNWTSWATHPARNWGASSDPCLTVTHLVADDTASFLRSIGSRHDGPELGRTLRNAQPPERYHICVDVHTSQWFSSASYQCYCGLQQRNRWDAAPSTWVNCWLHHWSKQQLYHLSHNHANLSRLSPSH